MQQTIRNRTIFCRDNLEILRGIDSASIDLIYLDPPFNKKKRFTAPIGSSAEGASFQDIFREEDVKNEWLGLIVDVRPELCQLLNAAGSIGNRSDKNYLIYMAIRLIELHRILAETGSLYLHCDPTMSHWLKLLLDALFGAGCFRNEIVWHYRRWTATTKDFQRLHDVLFRYVKNNNNTFNLIYEPSANEAKGRQECWVWDDTKKRYYRWQSLRGKRYIIFKNEKGVKAGDVWQIPFIHPSAKERVGYPTQKPLALLERIIEASSNRGDVVLDPFCGCATTCIAAERLGRQWVGIDISKQAYHLVRMRAQRELANDMGFDDLQVFYREDIPERTDRDAPTRRKPEIKHELYGRQEGHCAGCRTLFDYRNLTVDHIVPRAAGGDDPTNLQLLCGSCNSIKGERDMPYLMKQLRALGIVA